MERHVVALRHLPSFDSKVSALEKSIAAPRAKNVQGKNGKLYRSACAAVRADRARSGAVSTANRRKERRASIRNYYTAA